MRCPQCGADNPDDRWNCVSCRINLYWAHEHYAELARIRAEQGLSDQSPTPPFLREVHRRAHADRDTRGLNAMNKVRGIARRVMHGEADASAPDAASPETS